MAEDNNQKPKTDNKPVNKPISKPERREVKTPLKEIKRKGSGGSVRPKKEDS